MINPMTRTYELDSQDTLASILAKVQFLSSERVLFIVPGDLSLSAVSLRALRQRAALEQVSVALVTANPALRALAAHEGISTFRDRTRAEKAHWRRPRSGRALPISPAASPAETETPPAAGLFARRSPSGWRPVAFLRAFVRHPNPWWASLGIAVILLALFLSLLYALSVIVPSATVTVVPVAESLSVTVPLRAVQDARLDADAGVVPAQVLSVQVSGEARTETTGRRAEPATKASGSVVFINRTSRETLVPVGTIVSTATGNNVQFVTTADLLLAPNGRASTRVEAVLPGPSGNVRAGTITRVEGPLSLSLVVANAGSFAGGTTAQVGVVTEEDKERLQEQLFEELKKQAQERLRERNKGNEIQPESISYLALSPAFTPFVGEVSRELYLSMSVQAVGLSVDQAGASQIALARLQAAMPPGTRLVTDSIRYTFGPAAMQDERTVVFSVAAEGVLLRGLDTRTVRRAITGLSPEEASRVLVERFRMAAKPAIAVGPDWLPYIVPINLPALPWRIRVVVDWDAAARQASRL